MSWIPSTLPKQIHPGLMKNNLRRHAWLGGSYLLVLMLLLPLRVMMTLPRVSEPFFQLNTFWRIYSFASDPFQLVLMMGVPAVAGMLVFHYLKNGSAADFLHSLPVKRSTFFGTCLTAGLLLITVPVILTTLFSLILVWFSQASAWLTAGDVLRWAGTTLLMNLVIYSFTVLVGMFTGVTAAQGAFTYILLFLPVGLGMLITYNLEALVFGFSSHHLSMSRLSTFPMESLSPLVRIANLPYDALRSGEVLSYLAASLFLALGAWQLYKHRRMERNRQTIVFQGLRYLFLLGITLCVMLVGGLYSSLMNSSIPWIIAAYVFFSLLGYTIAQAVLQKSLRIFSLPHYRAYIPCLIVIFLLVGGITTDILGYEKRVPDMYDVEGAYAGQFWYAWNFNNKENNGLYRTPENIALVRELHQAVLDQENRQSHHPQPYRNLSIAYQLKGGGLMLREYQIDETRYTAYLEALRESEEDKHMEYPILTLEEADVIQIVFRASETEKRAFVHEPEEIQELLALMQQEILDADYQSLHVAGRPLGTAHIRVNPEALVHLNRQTTSVYGDELTFVRRQSFHQVESWLKARGYYEQATLVPSDIHRVAVEKVNSREEMELLERRWVVQQPENLVTEDAAHITESLALYEPAWWNQTAFPVYMVGFYNELGEQLFMGRFENEALPSFLTE